MKKTFAALSAALFMNGCSEVTLHLPEAGVYDCQNELDGREFSFDTQNKLHLAEDFNAISLIFKDIHTGNHVQIKGNENWVCTGPEGGQVHFGSNLSLSV